MPTAAAAVENIPEKCIWQSSPSFYYIIIRPTKGKVYNAERKFSLMSRVSQDCCVVVYASLIYFSSRRRRRNALHV
jgi:hypothetical protein